MRKSLRVSLANRFAVTALLGLFAVCLVGWIALRYVLDQEIDSSLLNLASIQASSVTDSPDGEMHFHEWDLTPEEAVSVRDLNRYAQIWNGDGASLLRTRYITQDLPLDQVALERARAGEVMWVEHDFDGIPIRSLYYGLERHGAAHTGHVLQVSAPLEARNATLFATGVYLAGIVVLTVIGAWLGAWWLGGSAVRPVHDIINQAREIEGGTLDHRIDAYADVSEYRGLVDVLNSMLHRLQLSFLAQRRFTQDASHELRGPLTALRGELEVALRRKRSEREYLEVLESSLEEVDRLGRISEDLLHLARSDGGDTAPRFEVRPLAGAVEVAGDRLASAFDAQGVILDTTGVTPVAMSYDLDLMARLVWNLLDNALEHTPEGGTVAVAVKADESAVRLEVADSGPGIEPAHRDRVFERFFRADPARGPRPGGRQGTGLGLSIVQAIAAAHGGEATVSEGHMGGALISIRFPIGPAI